MVRMGAAPLARRATISRCPHGGIQELHHQAELGAGLSGAALQEGSSRRGGGVSLEWIARSVVGDIIPGRAAEDGAYGLQHVRLLQHVWRQSSCRAPGARVGADRAIGLHSPVWVYRHITTNAALGGFDPRDSPRYCEKCGLVGVWSSFNAATEEVQSD